MEEAEKVQGSDSRVQDSGDEFSGEPAASVTATEGWSASDEQKVRRAKPQAVPSDISLSAHYACTHCGLSFEPPSPQMFSFNNPQGMCPECDGLGDIYSFDPEKLIPIPAVVSARLRRTLAGKWRDMGRWRGTSITAWPKRSSKNTASRHGTVLETAWEELDPAVQRGLLWGTGDEHITFTWRSGPSGYKWGGKFEGSSRSCLISIAPPKATCSGASSKNTCASSAARHCRRPRLNPQARCVSLASRSPDVPGKSRTLAARGLRAADHRSRRFFSELELDATRQTIAAEALKEIRGRLHSSTWGSIISPLAAPPPPFRAENAAHPPGRPDRLRAGGRALHPRRAFDRPASTRQRSAAWTRWPSLRDRATRSSSSSTTKTPCAAADHIIDFGPGPGVRGGEVVAAGRVRQIAANPASVDRAISFRPAADRNPRPHAGPQRDKKLVVRNAAHNNLKTSTSKFRSARSSA